MELLGVCNSDVVVNYGSSADSPSKRDAHDRPISVDVALVAADHLGGVQR